MTDVQVVPARAAVLAASLLARNRDSASNTLVSATADHHMGAVLVLLPPGASAAALGMNALIPTTAGWREAGLGEKQSVDFHAPVWTYELLFWAGRERRSKVTPEVPGPIDIPVWVVPDTGAVHAVDVDAMVAELQPQFDLAKAIFKDEDAVFSEVRTVIKAPKLATGFLKSLKGAVADLVNDIKGIGDTHQDLYLSHRGVPVGRWPAIDADWQARVDRDPPLAAWADFDLYRMRMTGAVWG